MGVPQQYFGLENTKDINFNSVIPLGSRESLPSFSNFKPVPDEYVEELKTLIDALLFFRSNPQRLHDVYISHTFFSGRVSLKDKSKLTTRSNRKEIGL